MLINLTEQQIKFIAGLIKASIEVDNEIIKRNKSSLATAKKEFCEEILNEVDKRCPVIKYSTKELIMNGYIKQS